MITDLQFKDEGVVLRGEFPHETVAVLNPTCIREGSIMHMFYRAVDANMISTIGYARFENNILIYRSPEPVIRPEFDYEIKGVEDPRMVLFEGVYHLFYTAYNGMSARIAYATSTDLKVWVKHGIISPSIPYHDAEVLFAAQDLHSGYVFYARHIQEICGPEVTMWDKDGFIFPERINGKIAFVHRIMPGIQIAYADSFADFNEIYWREYLAHMDEHALLNPALPYEGRKIGGGCPPIKTEKGWLFIYHAVEHDAQNDKRTYHACAVLFDLDDPQKIIGRLDAPLFSPKEPWELSGLVDNVVFPTGVNIDGDRIHIYYGAADKLIGAKSLSLEALLGKLKN